MSDFFDQVYEFTAKWEGGKCDHPDDRGGPTAYGVSLVFLTDFCRRNPEFAASQKVAMPVTRNSVLALDREQAKQILRHEFWVRSKVQELAPVAAAFTYDACVNFGTRPGIRLIQQAHNRVAAPLLTVDGIIGPKTVRALARDNPATIAEACELRRQRYRSLGKGSQKVFLKGWLNRANDQEKFLQAMFVPDRP